ncbi:hypothetical protein AMELA_G00177840 [Ameiurus melas]|uniref:Uncharacterized protein n=1 Tax=Ameiurus melas TaxID=219545 RepID=A0A7J6ACB0_AMEME|nr:hypothetical protein AMELA_G00177840 [Ameiurus melas]
MTESPSNRAKRTHTRTDKNNKRRRRGWILQELLHQDLSHSSRSSATSQVSLTEREKQRLIIVCFLSH